MKKLLFFFTFLCISFLSYSQSQNQDISMKPIVESVYNIVSTVEDQGFEVVKLEFDIVGSDSKTSYRKLSSAWTYSIGAYGDYKSEDMDIDVYKQLSDGTYQLVVSDTKSVSYAVVSVTPTEDAWYKFVIKCYKFKPGYSSCHYGLIIIHE